MSLLSVPNKLFFGYICLVSFRCVAVVYQACMVGIVLPAQACCLLDSLPMLIVVQQGVLSLRNVVMFAFRMSCFVLGPAVLLQLLLLFFGAMFAFLLGPYSLLCA